MYNKMLANIECIDLMPVSTNYSENIYWVYPILLNDKTDLNSQDVIKKLGEKDWYKVFSIHGTTCF